MFLAASFFNTNSNDDLTNNTYFQSSNEYSSINMDVKTKNIWQLDRHKPVLNFREITFPMKQHFL